MALRTWSGLGMGYGWQIASGAYNATQVAADLSFLYSVGFRKLRIYLPGYQAAAGTITNIQALVVQAMAAGFYVRWGVCTDQGALGLTATEWGDYKTYVSGTLAPWATSVGLNELIIGNEEEGHADGTTLTAATVRSDLKTLAGTVKSGGYLGVVSYDSEVNHSNIANWTSDGIGTNLDRLYFNVYDRLTTFSTTIQSMVAAFGQKTGVSEFNSLNLSGATLGYLAFNTEGDYYWDTVKRIQIMKDNGIKDAYFFTYRDGVAVGYTDTYAIALTTGAFRQTINAVAGVVSQERNQQLTARTYSVATNGTNAITVTSASAINFTATGQYSWFGRAKILRRASTSGTVIGTFVYKAVDSTSGYQILLDGGVLKFQERKTNTVWQQTQPSSIGYYNRWFDWVCTYDGTLQDIHFYINGVEQLSAVGTFSWANVVNNTATNMTFGKAASTENLFGFQSDCGMVARVLTRAEIAAFSVGTTPTTTAVSLALSEGTGTSLTDGSGNGNTCSITASTQWSTDTPQKARPVTTLTTTNALNFAAATATPRLTIANPAVLKSLTAVTFECWVNIPQRPTAVSNRLLFYNGAGSTGYLALLNTTGTFRFDVGNGTSQPATTSAQVINPGTWNHLAGVWDGANVTVYVNGRKDGSTNALAGGNTGDPGVTLVLCNANTNDRAVQGLVQEVRISNTARYSTDFIPQTTPFTTDANTLALWHLDDGSGTSPVDSSGNSLTLTMAGTTNPLWARGYLKKSGSVARSTASGRLNNNLGPTNALNFYTTTATPRVTVSDTATLDSLTALTVECWINITVADAYAGGSPRLIWKQTDANKGYYLSVSSTGVLECFVGNSTTTATASGATVLAPGWHHVAGTWNGSNVKVWLDGTQDGTAALSGGNTGNDSGAFVIGNRAAADRAALGLIQEVRVSNTARYTTTFSRPTTQFTTDANTLGLWHFNEGVALTVSDSSGNSLTGTLAGTTTPVWSLGFLKRTI